MQQMVRPVVSPKVTVTISPVTLAEVWAFALESGEFTELIGYTADEGSGRCAIGVLHEMMDRMGIENDQLDGERTALLRSLTDLDRRTAAALGHAGWGVSGANDAGIPLATIGRTIRQVLNSGMMRDYV